MRSVCASLMVWGALLFPGSGGAQSIPETVAIPAGPFIMGSDRAERDNAYTLDERAYGHSVTRKNRWYENEPRKTVTLPAYRITRTLITNAQYAAFVAATGHMAPTVDRATWTGYRLIHPYKRAERHIWRSGTFPTGRADHPVVMVSWDDANAYAAWLSNTTGKAWRLPTAAEQEKAARGTDGRYFPWGNGFDPKRLNSHDLGPFDTMPVGRFPAGNSPFGLVDAAGQVFEWTSTKARGTDRYVVKGGSWDDKGCGICRPAAAHGRPRTIKHILTGFRLVTE